MPASPNTQADPNQQRLTRPRASPVEFVKSHLLVLLVGGIAVAALVIAIMNLLKINNHPAFQQRMGGGGMSGGGVLL